ncbi:MAG: DAK2 domain-containing protein [Christensenellaceae bacterium]|nr:DAK2 domain-containing protein [Christensenellaceae bacterium]
MVVAATNYLEHNKKLLNDLNVFPVPDGDTGTNMLMTLVSAAREVNACDLSTAGNVAAALGDGALKGARGNSGVILSQLFRGFSQGIPKDKKYIVAEDFALAIEKGVEAAYKAVMKPKEGTILTVAKAMADEARKQIGAGANLLMLIDKVIDAGQAMLQKTPEMLPVLKEAGVVDAGGAGLIVIYKGFKMAIDGEEITSDLDLSVPKAMPAAANANMELSTANIEFGYCTEFFITHMDPHVTEETIERLRDKLMGIGDSLVVVGDPNLVKVHVHTNVPGKALQYALRLGQLTNIKIDNMREQHRSLTGLAEEKPKKPVALVAVSAGEGLDAIFKDFNVDELVSGGQSMNPSAEDIGKAIEAAPSDCVIVLPNNKNIILAAEQAAELTEKKVIVIPTKTFPQGLSAVLAFREDAEISVIEKEMREAIGNVKSGQVTHAVRDTHLNGEEIKKDEVLGIFESDIVAHKASMLEAVTELLHEMTDDDDAVISLYYGEDVSEEDAEELAEEIEMEFDEFDVEVYNGKQPVYDYILSVE